MPYSKASDPLGVAEAGWALVTGAAGGIGAAVCRQLAGQGLAVLMLDRDEAALGVAAAGVRAARGRAETLVADTTAPGAAEQAMACVRANGGRVDALVNVAGGSGPRPVRSIEELNDTLWEQVVALNLTTAFRFCRAAVPGMRARGYGRIVNLSSTVAHGRQGPVTTQGAGLAYATSKAALLGLTAQLAKDEAPHGITVNALLPALILADPGSRIRDRFDALPEAARAAMLNGFPTGRAGTAAEVAAVVGFLCSAAAGYVSGVALPVDGAFL